MEKKQEEQARQMKELQGHAERLQHENDQLRAQIEKSHNLGKDVRDCGRLVHPITHHKGKEPVIHDNVDTPEDDELSSGSSPSLSLSPSKNIPESIRAKSHKKPSHHPAFSDAISGASRRAKREARKRQNKPGQAHGNVLVLLAGTMPPMSFIHPTFGTGPTFHMPLVALIRRPDDMLSLPLG